MSFKVGIVGAARRHQGTGPFIARDLHALGHHISGIVGTSANSIADTVSALNNQYGIRTQGYESLNALIDQQPIDIVAICSPPDTHLHYLQQALSHGLHIFCEKPLWWPPNANPDYSSYQQQISAILELARQRQRYIHINAQWPFTLRDFHRLYPHALTDSGAIEQFAMHLSPQSRGPQMLVDAASHCLSMLYQLVGTGDIVDIVANKSTAADFDQITVQFKYVHQQGTTQVNFGLTNTQETPKPASYQINQRKVARLVALPDYQIQLQSAQTTLNIMDPLTTSIRDFIANIEAGLECDNVALEMGTKHLYKLIDACR